MKKFQLVTVDVWDTLLRRKCHPDAVKIHVSNYLLNNYFGRLKPEYHDAWTLMRSRQSIEGKIGSQYRARGLDDEYTQREVLELWLETVFTSTEALDSIASQLEKIELQQERCVVYADPYIEKLLSTYSAQDFIFVSDFYMGAEKLAELISHAGLDRVVTRGYSSCDHYLNKRSGRLFKFVHEKERVSADSTLHIGDHPHSDVHMPKTLGAASLEYLPKGESNLRALLKRQFENRCSGAVNPFFLLENQKPIPPNLSGLERQLYKYGVNCAPLLIGFILFVMEQSIRQGHEKVYFFTREGEFFKKIYDLLNSAQPLGQQAPPSEILEVSRLATFGPSLRTITVEELMRIWTLYAVQSPTALFRSLNVDQTGLIPYLQRYRIDPDEPLRYPWLDDRIIALFNDPAVCDFLAKEISINKASLMLYLQKKGLSKNSRQAAIVDIGWRGTIQDNLAHLLPDCQFDGYYLGLEKFLNKQPTNCSKSTFGPNLNLPEWGHLHDFFRTVAPIEMLCNSPNGSVVGYSIDNLEVRADRVVDHAENVVFLNYTQYFQQGVISSITNIADILKVHAIASKELRTLGIQIWQGIIKKPNPVISAAYFQLHHNELFGVGGFEDKRARIPNKFWIKAMTSRKNMQELAFQLEATGWAEGYLARDNLSFIWTAIKFARKARKYLREK